MAPEVKIQVIVTPTRIATAGHEHDIRSTPTKASAIELRKSVPLAQGMGPLPAAGRFFRYWLLGEVIQWTESTLTVRYLGPEDRVSISEFERPAGFLVPGLVTPAWAVARTGQRWILRRPSGDRIEATILGVDGEHAIIRRHDRSGRVAQLHLPSTQAVRQGGHLTHTFLCSNAVELHQKPSGRVIGNRLVSTLSKAVCTCGWSSYGEDRSDARWRARQHRELADSIEKGEPA